MNHEPDILFVDAESERICGDDCLHVAVHECILNLLSIVLIYPQICVGSKRLHDMGRSAWLLLAPAALSLATMVVAFVTRPAGVEAPGVITPALATLSQGMGLGLAVMGACLLIEVAFLLWVGLAPGQAGDNRHGSPPV